MTPPMDRTELIARLQSFYDVLHDVRDRAEDEGDRAYFGSTNDPETMQEQLFDLFTLIRELKQATIKAAVEGEVVCSFNPELAALESRPEAAAREIFDEAMRAARQDVGDWIREPAIAAMLRFATDTTPSRDAEGSVDREAIARACWHAADGPFCPWSAATDGAREQFYRMADAILALKASTPETPEWRADETTLRACKAIAAGFAHDEEETSDQAAENRVIGKIVAKLDSFITPETQTVEGGGQIPAGVYYSAEAGNFYEAETHKGLGNAFHAKWHARRREFPTDAMFAKPTPPERAKALEEAARVCIDYAENADRVVSRSAEGPCRTSVMGEAVAARACAAAIRALSASPTRTGEES